MITYAKMAVKRVIVLITVTIVSIKNNYGNSLRDFTKPSYVFSLTSAPITIFSYTKTFSSRGSFSLSF